MSSSIFLRRILSPDMADSTSNPSKKITKNHEEQKEPPFPPPTAAVFHQHHSHHTCANCGAPTGYPSSPPPDSNLTYVPIRLPAVNLPPNPTNTKEAIIRTPVPHAQKVVPLRPPYQFRTPGPRIFNQEDVEHFHSSSTCANFLGFIVSLSESIKSHKLSDPCHVSPAVSTIIHVLEKLNSFVDEIPPATQAARYGNVAYRTWHQRMSSEAENFHLGVLPSDLVDAVIELGPYFTDSFGNSSRIDYGNNVYISPLDLFYRFPFLSFLLWITFSLCVLVLLSYLGFCFFWCVRVWCVFGGGSSKLIEFPVLKLHRGWGRVPKGGFVSV